MIDLLRPLFNWSEAIVAAVILTAFGPLTRTLVSATRFERRWKERLYRAIPGVLILGWSAYGVWLIGLLVTDRITPNLIPVGAVLAVVVFAAWFAVRDVVGGAILRAEDVYEPGEWLRVGDTEGRIRRVGARSLEMEMEDGKRLRVPYSLLAGSTIVKAEPAGSTTAHTFTLRVPRNVPMADVKRQVQRAALQSMWSSTAQLPRVENPETSRGPHAPADVVDLEVTVYAIHPDYDLAVENVVREAASNGVE